MSAAGLSQDDLAGLSPVRLSNLDLQDDGFCVLEVVSDGDDVHVLIGDADGGDLTTLTEPGRFAQTWARLMPLLVGLPLAPDAGQGPRNEIAVHLVDGSALRWIGHGDDNPVYAAMAAFGMNDARVHSTPVLTQVDVDHPAFAAAVGDWP